jgi:type IV pilus assembly protein PilP
MNPFAITLVALAVGVLGACGDDGGSAPRSGAGKSTARAGKRDAGSISPEDTAARAQIATQFVYAYNALGKRDPFRSPEELRRSEASEGRSPCREPLCQWDLSQLQLKAVVTGDANPFALLEDPQGAGHIVRRNSQVGRQGGRVTQILRDSLTITEYFTQPDGKRAALPKDVNMEPDKGFVPATDLASGKMWE